MPMPCHRQRGASICARKVCARRYMRKEGICAWKELQRRISVKSSQVYVVDIYLFIYVPPVFSQGSNSGLKSPDLSKPNLLRDLGLLRNPILLLHVHLKLEPISDLILLSDVHSRSLCRRK